MAPDSCLFSRPPSLSTLATHAADNIPPTGNVCIDSLNRKRVKHRVEFDGGGQRWISLDDEQVSCRTRHVLVSYKQNRRGAMNGYAQQGSEEGLPYVSAHHPTYGTLAWRRWSRVTMGR